MESARGMRPWMRLAKWTNEAQGCPRCEAVRLTPKAMKGKERKRAEEDL